MSTGINVLLWWRNCSEAFPVWTEALSVTQFATLPFDLKRLFTKTRFRCSFCSDRSVQTWFGPFQKPIRYGTFHFQQRSGAVVFLSRKSFESSTPSVNRSPIWYTCCDAPFHYPVQCEHSLNSRSDTSPCGMKAIYSAYVRLLYKLKQSHQPLLNMVQDNNNSKSISFG